MIATCRPPGPYLEGLIKLSAMLPDGTVMAEVGCYAGESTMIFAKRVMHVYSIDAWANGWAAATIDNQNASEVEAAFDQRCDPLIKKGVIEKIKGPSLEMVKKFPDHSLGFVYHDADHRYNNFKADLEAWLPKVKRHGYIGGHDYGDETWGPDVRRAVGELLKDLEDISGYHGHKSWADFWEFEDGSWLLKL